MEGSVLYILIDDVVMKGDVRRFTFKESMSRIGIVTSRLLGRSRNSLETPDPSLPNINASLVISFLFYKALVSYKHHYLSYYEEK